MKAFSGVLWGAGAIALLSGCVVDGGYSYQRDPVRSDYTAASSAGYYDGYYGTYIGGYWASDGYFYYLDRTHNYRRDDGGHFRRERFQGAKEIRAEDRSHNRDRDRRSRNGSDDDNAESSTVYYDGYYGTYIGGYWASDGHFYYLDRTRNYRRDDGRHFRRQRFQGGQEVRAEDRSHDRTRRGRDENNDWRKNNR